MNGEAVCRTAPATPGLLNIERKNRCHFCLDSRIGRLEPRDNNLDSVEYIVQSLLSKVYRV